MTGTSTPRKKIGKPAGDIPTLINLGEQLGQFRRDSGRLQQDVATAAGVSRSTLHTIEHGGAGVRWEKVAAVAHALGLQMVFKEDPAR
ncbi:helix-turn-helix domain-containing protein [Corynebacterium alimapuense]|uniref:Transcriptional regulator n=1 Tax=Corynebacterium alimapuense TaxID=1576874 RepID=A0A3M8K8V7_9CORY|nr:helix-turn-helix transcriptional regulator [Corynebacterium alimapuense]RNE48944.1 transcriptional regulator [Corynebacterium alimapuense]